MCLRIQFQAIISIYQTEIFYNRQKKKKGCQWATTLAVTSADFTLEEKLMKEKWTETATAIFRRTDHPEFRIDETTET